MQNLGLVIRHEFSIRVKKGSFWAGILIGSIILILVVYLPVIIGLVSGGSQQKITVLNQTGQPAVGSQSLVSLLQTSLNPVENGSKAEFKLNFLSDGDLATLQENVRQQKQDGLLVVSRAAQGELKFEYFTPKSLQDKVVQKVTESVTRLALTDRLVRQGMNNPTQQATLFAPAQFSLISTRQEKQGLSEEESGAVAALTFLMIVLLFGAVIGYGTVIAQGVAEEKGHRIMEIIVSAATPSQLMFGKIIGIGLVGLSSYLVTILIVVPAYLLKNWASQNLLGEASTVLPVGLTVQAILYFLLFFLLGFYLYATLYAAVGSLCSRAEDVNQAVGGLGYLQMVGYLLSIFALSSIEAGWVKVCSFIPFFSPMLMLARVLQGSASALEVLVAVGLLVLTSLLFTWLAARIYRNGVLMYGKRPRFGQLVVMALRPALK